MNGRQLLLAVWCGLLLQPALAAAPVTRRLGATVPRDADRPAWRVRPCRRRSTSGAWKRAHLPKDAPNILIILLDDVGFGLADTYGGPIRTPTLSRIANAGISYNTFHTTSICSPTRAALADRAQPPARRFRDHRRTGGGLGRLHRRDPPDVCDDGEGAGSVWLQDRRVRQMAQHAATDTTAMGPFTLWPTGEGIGFDYFYGFLAGETSQWEPRLVENFNVVEPPHDEKYHLSEDLADKAIGWMRKHQAYAPDKPFLMYWAPGAGHGPHHIFKEWADKYKGQFDDGWDALRERTFKRQKELGWIPADTKLTPRAASMAAWDSIPECAAPVPAPPDGDLRRLRRARGRPGR